MFSGYNLYLINLLTSVAVTVSFILLRSILLGSIFNCCSNDNGFLPTLAQGAGQSIESAYELFRLLDENKKDIQNIYFQERLKRAKTVRKRSNLNFFAFHFSSSIMQLIRNFILKFLIKRKNFINFYLGTVYKN